MGLTLTWLSVIVLIPLAGLFIRSFELSPDQFWGILTSRRTLNALKMSFGLAFAAACVNLVMGTIIVWALVRYRFPGRRLFDAIVDIPFALPTAVAGVALSALFARKGLSGRAARRARHQGRLHTDRHLRRDDLHRHPLCRAHGAARADDLDPEIEEAAASLGASRWHIISRVILPSLTPALLTGLRSPSRAPSANTAR